MVRSCAIMIKFFSVLLDGDNIEYEISNRGFSDFLRTYYCDFLNNVHREMCSVVGKVLPELQCLNRQCV